MSRIFTLGCIVTPSGQINQVQSNDLDTGIEEILAYGDGKVDPDFAAVAMQAPRISFTTTAIARALGYAGLAGLALTSACDFYYQQYAQGGTRTSGAALKVTAEYGLIVPTSLAANQKEATLSYDVITRTNDGTTAPIAAAVNQTMPALTATDQLFVAGPASVNGTALNSVESIALEFNLDVMTIQQGGHVFPSFVAIRRRSPVLVVQSYDLQLLNALGVSGAAQGATDSFAYLRRVAQDTGARVADATASHIKFTVDAGRIQVGKITGPEGEAMAEVRVTPTFDGTADVIAISTGVAIT